MATSVEDAAISTGRRPTSADVEPPPFKPIKAWAVLGGAFLALETYIFADWILSGNAKRTPTGPTPVPDWMKIIGHSWEVAGLIAGAVFVYFFLIRPWRRQGHITLDGLFVIVFLSMYWQDPLPNYANNWLSYNPMFFNLGSWTTSVPGWVAPRSELFAEPLLLFAPIYIYTIFGVIVFGNYLMRTAKQRWPHLGNFGLVMWTLGFMIFADIVIETFWMRLGWWSWGGSIDWLTLNHGKYYQYPIYEGIIWGTTWTVWACLRFFRDDKGRTVAERGSEHLRVTGWKHTGVRFLALTGICNLIFMIFYTVPAIWFGLQAHEWPEDVQKRSYLTGGLCGPGTTYACSGPSIPFPRPNSAHISPDGKLVVPPGAD